MNELGSVKGTVVRNSMNQIAALVGKILIVDDFRTNIAYLNQLLKNEGHEVMPAVEVDMAIHLIGTHTFDIILLDVEMPVNNGFELCKKIRKSELNFDTPVIFITSKDDQQSILTGFDAGGQDYITRPFSERELLARVNTQLELKIRRSALVKLNDQLEKLVALRTRELRNLLEMLKASNHELGQAKKELESLDSAKEQFLRIINHEIRTPLNGILGFQLLLKDANLDEKYAEYLRMMNKSVKRLEKFSLQALLITQLRTGNFIGEQKAIWVDTVFQKAISESDDQLKGKKLRLQCKIGPATYITDGNLFRYLIDNLIEIGINYCNTGGLIEISGRLISCNRYVLTLCHTGQAFPESVLLNPQALFSEENFTDSCPHLLLYTVRLILNHLHGELVLRNNQGGPGALVEITMQPGASNPEEATNQHQGLLKSR